MSATVHPSVAPSPPLHHQTAPQDRVSTREKIGLGLGRMVAEGTHGSQYVLVNPVYNMQLGMNPALFSLIDFMAPPAPSTASAW